MFDFLVNDALVRVAHLVIDRLSSVFVICVLQVCRDGDEFKFAKLDDQLIEIIDNKQLVYSRVCF